MVLFLLAVLLAAVSALAYAFLRGWGIAGLIVLLVGGAVAYALQLRGDNATTAVYILAFGLAPALVVIAIGAGAGALLRDGRYGLATVPFLALLGWGAIQWFDTFHDERAHAAAVKFISGHPQLRPFTRGVLRPSISSRNSRDNTARYEFPLQTVPPSYAIVDVERSWFHAPPARLACVTRLYLGQRQGNATACEEGTVSLTDPMFQPRPPVAAVAAARGPTAAPPAIPAAEPEIPALAAAELAGLPADAEVWMLGVHQARQRIAPKPGDRAVGDVRVQVAGGKRPLVLVLSNHEPVHWVIDNQGRPISAVLVSGRHPASVTGVSAPVRRIGTSYAIREQAEGHASLRAATEQATRRPVRGLLGAYDGSVLHVPPP